nr:MAG TPA: hypothetical protein [Caudoviricetes sp.]
MAVKKVICSLVNLVHLLKTEYSTKVFYEQTNKLIWEVER